jgi:glyoxylase-like metal-dependent hydrolase (beta-lactamase superfamily II)
MTTPTHSRRDFVLSAAAASAFFGLSRQLVLPAEAQDAARQAKPFHAFKVGDIEIVTVSDGGWSKDHDPGFIKNASVDDTKAALKAAGLDDGKVYIPFTVTFARVKGKTIMFDAGTGGQLAPTAGALAANMAAAGIDPKNVSTIVVTHFHPDHIFGLMAKETNAQIYPDAEIVVPAAEYAFWTDPALIPKLPEARQGLAKRIQATLPTWKNVRQIAGGTEVLPGITAISAHGHTAGHTVYQVGSGKDQLLVLADITNIPALFAKHPEWHAAFDSDGVMAEQSRRKLFDRVVADKTIMTGYHYGMPGAGRIEKDGAGYAFVPLA